MTGKEIKNVTASVLAKLRNTSKSSGAPLQQVLQLYAIERFLYRPRMIEFPVLLGGDAIHLVAYPIESSIAEKLQAMVALGNANSRMKDFYDVWICSNHLDFNADELLKAIDATFKNRETPFPAGEVEALTTPFVEGHRVQWNVFVKKIGETELIDEFGKIVNDVKVFAMPALHSLAGGERLTKQWKAGRGWVAV